MSGFRQTAERPAVAELLAQLVSIPSVSGDEAAASKFLVSEMRKLGYRSAEVDAVGNAVGERGPADAKRVLMLLGHIDTVPGEIPVRFEPVSGSEERVREDGTLKDSLAMGGPLEGRAPEDMASEGSTSGDRPFGGRESGGESGAVPSESAGNAVPDEEATDEILHGRGTVDAKGPLATFTMAVSRIPEELLQATGTRLVVVGAVEEESATSRGARAIRDRFDGLTEPVPAACIIGEPSRFHRVTLGYKGRILIDVRAERELTHTAGPDPGIAVQIVAFWNLLAEEARRFNDGIDAPFAQLQPGLRDLRSGLEDGMHSWAEASVGVRLPLGFDVEGLLNLCVEEWSDFAARLEGADETWSVPTFGLSNAGCSLAWSVGDRRLQLTARGYEPAWKSERSSALVRAFQRSIREAGARPGFVVKTGTSDMNVVGPAWRCPILAYGPGDSALDHTPREHASVRELGLAQEVLEGAIRAWVQPES